MNHPFSPQELERFAARLAKLSGRASPPTAGQAGPSGKLGDAGVDAALTALERTTAADGPGALDAVLGLDKLLDTAIDQLAPQDVSTVLRRIVGAFSASGSDKLKQAIRGRVLGFFETTVKALLRDERLDKVEPFVTRFVDAVRGSDLVGGHQLGRVIRQVDDTLRGAREGAKQSADDGLGEVAPEARAADRFVRRLIARSDVAASIAVVRTLGLDAEARNRRFIARYDSKLLGINIGVLSRFENALRIPDKAMRFDKRFQILGSIFPDVAGDEDALGKFGWVAGLDHASGLGEGYDGALFGLDALQFASPTVVGGGDRLGGLDLGELNLGGLGGRLGAGLDLGALSRTGIAARRSGPSLKPLDKPTTKIGGTSKGLAGRTAAIKVGGASEVPDVSTLFGGKMVRLPKDAVDALQARDFGRFERAVQKGLPPEVARAVLRNVRGGRAPAFGGGIFARPSAPTAPAGGGMGGLGHVALGFQGLAQGGARSRALDGIARLKGAGAGMGFVAGSPSAALRAGATAAVRPSSFGGSLAMSLPRGAHGVAALAAARAHAPHALGSLSLPAPARLGLGRAAPAFSDAVRMAATGGASPAVVRTALAAPRLGAAAQTGGATVQATAIAHDAFGVPRFRGARPLSAAGLRALDGFDLSGSVVVGSRAASASRSLVTGGAQTRQALGALPAIGAAPALGALPALARDARGPALSALPALGRAPARGLPSAAARAVGASPLASGSFLPVAGAGRSSLGSMLLAQAGGHRPSAAVRDDYGIVRVGGRQSGSAPADVRVLDLAGAGQAVSLPALAALRSSSRGAMAAAAPSLQLAGHRVIAPALALGGAAASASPAARRVGRAAAAAPARRPMAARASEGHAQASAAGIGALPGLVSSGFEAPARRAGRGERRAPATTTYGSVADLAFDRGGESARPASIEKYYAPVTSRGLGVGRMQDFELASFAGGARPSAQRTTPVAGGDFAPAHLARLAPSAAPSGSRPEHWRVAYDEAGFAPTQRLGRVAATLGAVQSTAARSAAKYEGGVERVRGTYSGARLKAAPRPQAGSGVFAGGAAAGQSLLGRGFAGATPQALAAGAGAAPGAQALVAPGRTGGAPGAQETAARGATAASGQARADRAGAAPGAQALPDRGSARTGRQVEGPRGGASPAAQRAAERGGAAAPGQRLAAAGFAETSGSTAVAERAFELPARRPGRRAEPRLEGVYGRSSAEQTLAAPGGSDVLGLASAGFEARRAPSTVSRRYEVLGVDPEGIGATRPSEQRILVSGGRSTAAAQRLEPSLGAVASSAQRLAASAAAGAAASPAQGAAFVAPTRTTAQAAALAGTGKPAEAQSLARRAGAPVARPTARATEGEVFGFVPKQITGTIRDRFRLDGWMGGGPLSASAGPISLGVRPAGVERGGLDLRVEHAFVKFPGRLSSVATEGAIPVDLTSQLSGRSQIAARSARARRDRGVDFALRNFEVPAQGLFWAPSETGPVEHREVPFRLRYQAIEPQRVYGRVESSEPRAKAQYELAAGRTAGRPQLRALPRGAALRQEPGTAAHHALNVHVAARFAPEGTDVRWSSGVGADLTGAPGFRRGVSRRARQVVLGRQRQAELGLDLGRANELLERNLDALREARRLYRAGVRVPVGPAWRLQLQLVQGGEAAREAAAPSADLRAAPSARMGLAGPRLAARAERSTGVELSDLAEALIGRRPQAAPAPAEAGGAPQQLAPAAGAATSPQAFMAPRQGSRVTIQRAAPRGTAAPAQRYASGPALRAESRGGPAQEMRGGSAESVAYVAPQAPRPAQASAEAREERARPRAVRERDRVVAEPYVTGDRREQEDIELFERRGIQRKTHWVADTQMQRGVPDGDRMARVEGARKPSPPVANITQLVYQIYNRLKREMEIDMERRTGAF